MSDLAPPCQLAAADAGGLARLDLTEQHYRLQRNIASARDYVPAIDLLANQLQQTRRYQALSEEANQRPEQDSTAKAFQQVS
ncbi:MAG TPA: hypothetical protein VMU39_19335 [Solirubrobacteraceae bacterium]|nr:hypothetical protein [Solirubrobacteraceae bacterium]